MESLHVGDFVVTLLIGFFYKGYDFINYTESYLGNSSSPYAIYIKIWGVIFSLLFIIYAFVLRKAILAKGSLQLVVTCLIIIYGNRRRRRLGLFPYDYIGDKPFILATGKK